MRLNDLDWSIGGRKVELDEEFETNLSAVTVGRFDNRFVFEFDDNEGFATTTT